MTRIVLPAVAFLAMSAVTLTSVVGAAESAAPAASAPVIQVYSNPG